MINCASRTKDFYGNQVYLLGHAVAAIELALSARSFISGGGLLWYFGMMAIRRCA